MRVHEASDGLCLVTELLHSVASQPYLQDFDGGLSLQMKMLAEIHIGVAASSKQTDQAIVADLLSDTIVHFPLPRLDFVHFSKTLEEVGFSVQIPFTLSW